MKNNILLILALSTSNMAIAEEKDEHREHGAHEHGHASLSVILEKNELVVMLETPAMNVFGFEHKPKNEEQHKVVHEAVEDLENFGTLLSVDSSANCSVIKTEVKQPFEMAEGKDHKDEHDDHKDEHDDHKDEHDDHKDEHAEKHKDHDDDHKESVHSDVDVEITYSCENASKLTKMDLSPLFKRFPLFVELDAQGIINSQQSAAELNKANPVLSLRN